MLYGDPCYIFASNASSFPVVTGKGTKGALLCLVTCCRRVLVSPLGLSHLPERFVYRDCSGFVSSDLLGGARFAVALALAYLYGVGKLPERLMPCSFQEVA